MCGGFCGQVETSNEEESYLLRTMDTRLPKVYLVQRERALTRFHAFLSAMLERSSISPKFLRLLSAVDFFTMIKHVHKSLFAINYARFNGKRYIRGTCTLRLIKKLSNRYVLRALLSPNLFNTATKVREEENEEEEEEEE